MMKPVRTTLLLVEDDALIATTTALKLKCYGYEVLMASTGQEAVHMVRETPDIDLVLMDVDLGEGFSGPEAAREILRTASIPIIFLTAHAEREMVEKVKGITRYGYVIKNSGDFVLRSSIEMAFELHDAHKKLEAKVAALERSEILYRSLMDNSIDAIYLLNYEGTVLGTNAVACTMLGYTHDELMKMSIEDIDANYSRDGFQEFWKGNPKNVTLLFETMHRRRDGSIFPVEVNGIFFDIAASTYLYGVARDLTGRKATEALLLSEKEKLERVLAEIGRADDASCSS